MEGYIAQIILFAGNFAPRGWAFCHGQLISIAQNTALFALLGTTYGGNGQTTFALPDLRGRVAVGTGQGPGLSFYTLGQLAGAENITLTTNEIPAHTHALRASSADATERAPGVDRFLAREATAQTAMYATTGIDTTLSPQAISTVGSSQPHSNVQPYLAMNYVICMSGIFPSRN